MNQASPRRAAPAPFVRRPGAHRPTATLVGIQALAAPDVLFEMDATAAVKP